MVTTWVAVQLQKEKEEGKGERNKARTLQNQEYPKFLWNQTTWGYLFLPFEKWPVLPHIQERNPKVFFCVGLLHGMNGFQMKGVTPFDTLWAISDCSLPFFNFCQCWLTFKSFSVLSCERIPLTMSIPMQCAYNNYNSDKSHFIQMQQLSFYSSFLSQDFILFF